MGQKINIAIAMSTHNRGEIARKVAAEWKKLLPPHSVFLVVDDGSTEPFEGADFRFDTPQGIAISKNKCLELCYDSGAEHIFLVDDDIYPLVKNWYTFYTLSRINHLCFTFGAHSDGSPNGRKLLRADEKFTYWESPCGLLLYFRRICLERVGGMDPEYGTWSFEHVGLSRRIHNAGLTPAPFMDVVNSGDLFYSYDQHKAIERSVPAKVRKEHLHVNARKYAREIRSNRYIPFRKLGNLILTCFLTLPADPQRGRDSWENNPELLQQAQAGLTRLRKSVEQAKAQAKIVVLSDVWEGQMDGVQYVKVGDGPTGNPYMDRWVFYSDYLSRNRAEKVFCVDMTDVEMLRDPFGELDPRRLYTGDERGAMVHNHWMTANHQAPVYRNLFHKGAFNTLLNAGIVGGYYEMVHAFVQEMAAHFTQMPPEDRSRCRTDMAGFNHTAYYHFFTELFYGPQVCTVFKKEQRPTRGLIPWFKHK